MDISHWVVPQPPPSTSFDLLFVPAWADRIASTVGRGTLHRRSAPLVSRWLSMPLVVAVDDSHPVDGDAPLLLPATPGAVRMTASLRSTDGGALFAHATDPIRVATTMSEFVRCIGDVCEASGVPVSSVRFTPNTDVELCMGPLLSWPRQRFVDACWLLSFAMRLCALARGFVVGDVVLVTPDAAITIDATLDQSLAR
jgi:hypothetical protein